MGGPGSGNRWRYGAMSTTDERCALDVRRLAREGALQPGYRGKRQWTRYGEAMASIQLQADKGHLILMWRSDERTKWKNKSHLVHIARTPCNLGGTRAWFVCPAASCGRRVAVLYSSAFVCRHCSRLAYASQREDAAQRAASQADKIRARLGWRPGILNSNGDRPKSMRWQTFWRLQSQIESLTRKSLRLWSPPA